MPQYQELLISTLTKLWKQRMPDWVPASYPPIPWALTEHCFTNHSYLRSTGRVFHLLVEFTPKWPGAFTGNVLVADSDEPFGVEPPVHTAAELTALPVGSYPINLFLGHSEDVWWHIMEGPGTALQRLNDWIAPDYVLPFDDIVMAAAVDFVEAVTDEVWPVLQRNVLAMLHNIAGARHVPENVVDKAFLASIRPDVERLFPKGALLIQTAPTKPEDTHTNPTIRIVHPASGLSATCGDFTSQAENYIAAILRLKTMCDAQGTQP